VLRVHASAIRLDAEFLVFAYFINSEMVKYKKGFVFSASLIREFEDSLKTLNIPPHEFKIHYISGFINELSAMFQYSVSRVRICQQRVLSGVALRKELGEHFLETNKDYEDLVLLTPIRFNYKDPWDMSVQLNMNDFRKTVMKPIKKNGGGK
jgi:hypothetical protein